MTVAGKSLWRLRRVAKWMADYAVRAVARPCMMSNLTMALRALGRDRQARAVSAVAVNLAPDQTTPRHVVWLALDELIANQRGPGVE
ncbi:MAG TPA: hypothetical protein VLI90_05770 [Tepidisphaeraceae bacterium]|nr:hypothetical protein [Tepidisphaeraceae bacterium]